jgi:hypothetical protein
LAYTDQPVHEVLVCSNPECRRSTSRNDGAERPESCPSCGSPLDFLPAPNEDAAAAAATSPVGASGGSDLAPGEQFAGRYRIERKIDQGGMGAVYLAHDEELDRRVALKIPLHHADLDYLKRFRREARAGAQLSHACICRVLDVSRTDSTPYLTMEFIEGEPLSKTIKAAERGLPPRESIRIVRTVAAAMADAHAHKIIHRDLKPSNIMLRPDGSPVLMDFGLARRESDEALTLTGVAMGTPAYMPPEQARGDAKLIGPRSDIYSLGVILFELLTGSRPFAGSTMSILGQILSKEPSRSTLQRARIPQALQAVCLKAMSKDAAARYGSMEEFAAALDAAELALEAGAAPRPSRSRTAALIAALVLAAAGVAWLLAHRPDGMPGAEKGPAATTGVLWGGIEVGAKGVKASTLRIREDGLPELTERLKSDRPRVNNVTLAYRDESGNFRREAIDDARDAVAGYFQRLTQQLEPPIPLERVRVVSSSGLVQRGRPENYSELAKAVSVATGGTVQLSEIDVRTEVRLSILGGLPRDRWTEAVYVDIGSGNSKLGYYISEDKTEVADARILGTTDLTQAVEEIALPAGSERLRAFAAAARVRCESFARDLRGDLGRKGGFLAKNEVCLAGGAVWAVLVLKDPAGWAREGVLVDFPLAAVETLRDEIVASGQIPRPGLSHLDEKTKRIVEAQVSEVLSAFNQLNLIAGMELILMFADALEWRGGKKLYFTKAGLDAWLIGYIFEAATRGR